MGEQPNTTPEGQPVEATFTNALEVEQYYEKLFSEAKPGNALGAAYTVAYETGEALSEYKVTLSNMRNANNTDTEITTFKVREEFGIDERERLEIARELYIQKRAFPTLLRSLIPGFRDAFSAFSAFSALSIKRDNGSLGSFTSKMQLAYIEVNGGDDTAALNKTQEAMTKIYNEIQSRD